MGRVSRPRLCGRTAGDGHQSKHEDRSRADHKRHQYGYPRATPKERYLHLAYLQEAG
jgi:hypothetical protein